MHLRSTYRVFTELLVGAHDAFLPGPLRHNFGVGNHDSHQAGLQPKALLINEHQTDGIVGKDKAT